MDPGTLATAPGLSCFPPPQPPSDETLVDRAQHSHAYCSIDVKEDWCHPISAPFSRVTSPQQNQSLSPLFSCTM